jgi:hypothetical protein
MSNELRCFEVTDDEATHWVAAETAGHAIELVQTEVHDEPRPCDVRELEMRDLRGLWVYTEDGDGAETMLSAFKSAAAPCLLASDVEW